MRIDEITNRVFVRQSWLKDMLLCPERARLAVVQPTFKTQNDSAAIGTAVHAGIEAVLNGHASTTDAPYVSVNKFIQLEETGVRHTNVDPAKWHHYVAGLTEAWVKDIYPHVPQTDGKAEVAFAVPTGTMVNGMELWFEGTMDYLQPKGIWDWKTAARKYSISEKQNQDIQSSIYGFAGAQLGITSPDSVFNFGVMIRVNEPYGQIITIKRTAAHHNFVIKQAAAAVASACAMMTNKNSPMDNHWLINDQHFLCSQRWCPWWSICKGAHVSEPDNEIEE